MEREKISRAYTIAGVVLLLFCVLNLVIENLVYVNSRKVYDRNITSVQYLTDMNMHLADINDNVLLLVAGTDQNNGNDIQNKIDTSFAELLQTEEAYKALGGQSGIEQRRYQQASLSIAAYQKKINEVRGVLTASDNETACSIYEQELSPLQVCASEMLTATMEIGTKDADANVHRSSIMHGISQAVLILLAIVGVAGLIYAGKKAVAASDEIVRKGEELEEASERLDRSRQKMEDAAMMNILTGMYNRYALEERLAELIGTGQFNIAIFDLDCFKAVNDTYGFEIGDAYLSGVAERLQMQYGESAEMYNLYGGEFCLLFDEEVTDMQAQTLAEQIRKSFSGAVDAEGVAIACTASASMWHVLPNENLSVHELLMKLSNALHAAKRDGGDRLYYIT
ncbi:MAG: diguanylate cyclase [Oscillospiraceae bacterium]|nr:diguanylate cyclase [Oscillospiraceae bacterium]